MKEINIIQFNIILIEYLFAYTINVANVYKIDLKNHHYILVDMTDVVADSAGIVDNVDSTDDMIQTPWKDMEQMVATFKIQANQMSQQFRLLQKTTQKQIAQLKKEAGKPKTKSKVARKPSGFAKPSKISKELAAFMGKDEDVDVARTEVTQFVIAYIKDNKLAESKDIKPDKKLQELLGPTGDDKITYFNIQKFMNKHFIKY